MEPITQRQYAYAPYDNPSQQLRAGDLSKEFEMSLLADGDQDISAGSWTHIDQEGYLASVSGEWLKIGDRLGITDGADATWASVEGEGPEHGLGMYLNDPDAWESAN